MAHEPFETQLSVGGHANSLGNTAQVIAQVLRDKARIPELFVCMFAQDAWVRMRAADAFEKVCRERPDWVQPFVSRIQAELHGAGQQPSIKWHIAQIYTQVALAPAQKQRATAWLADQLVSPRTDWIVAANAMQALAFFTKSGDFAAEELLRLLHMQLRHKSPAVVKKAAKLIDEFS